MTDDVGVDLTGVDLDALIAQDRSEQFHMLLGFWLGGLIYGLYIVLFVLSMRITWKNWSTTWSYSSRVFFVGTVSMLVLTTAYMVINARRYLAAFTPDVETIQKGWPPVYYLRDYKGWDSFTAIVIMDILVWLADALVIYRCFIIWGGNWWIILIPVLLLLLSMVSGILVLVWFRHPETFLPYPKIMPLFDMTYPVNLSQSLLTTGLIVFKLWRQHRLSRAAGLAVGGAGVGLFTIMRIIVESATILAFQHFMLMVTYLTKSTVQYVFHGTLVPSIGVALVLIALRAYVATNETVSLRIPQTSSSAGTRSSALSPSAGSIAHYQTNRSMVLSSGGLVLTSISEPTRHARSRSTHIVSMQTVPQDLEKLDVDVEKGISPGDSSADVGLRGEEEGRKVGSRDNASTHVSDDDEKHSGKAE